ncbi:MAG TPA: hypothetical protein VK142_11495 [Bacillota bacterium]|nr:hypothetical protein [Bacillota bacterium]
MFVMNERRIRDEKIAQLKRGRAAYAESHELIRLMKRRIEQENIQVHYDNTHLGCWITPLEGQKTS